MRQVRKQSCIWGSRRCARVRLTRGAECTYTAAARALYPIPDLDAEEICRRSMKVAAGEVGSILCDNGRCCQQHSSSQGVWRAFCRDVLFHKQQLGLGKTRLRRCGRLERCVAHVWRRNQFRSSKRRRRRRAAPGRSRGVRPASTGQKHFHVWEDSSPSPAVSEVAAAKRAFSSAYTSCSSGLCDGKSCCREVRRRESSSTPSSAARDSGEANKAEAASSRPSRSA